MYDFISRVAQTFRIALQLFDAWFKVPRRCLFLIMRLELSLSFRGPLASQAKGRTLGGGFFVTVLPSARRNAGLSIELTSKDL